MNCYCYVTNLNDSNLSATNCYGLSLRNYYLNYGCYLSDWMMNVNYLKLSCSTNCGYSTPNLRSLSGYYSNGNCLNASCLNGYC